MSQQSVGELGYGEDEDQIEEQFDESDAGVLMALADAQQMSQAPSPRSYSLIHCSRSFSPIMQSMRAPLRTSLALRALPAKVARLWR